MKMKAFASFCALLVAGPAFGFMTVQESNEVTPAGKFKLGAEPQIRTSSGSGMNFSGFFDAPVNDAMSVRANVGTGDTDFSAGGSFKWVPFPDYGKQPAVGLKVGGYWWRESSESFTTLRFDPIVSKKFDTEIGLLVPYASIPVMFNSGKDYNKTSLQVAFGSELMHPETDNMTFGAEIGFDGKDSFSYVSGYVTIYLDDTNQTSTNRIKK